MPVWRNFFLGSEPTKGTGPFKSLDVRLMRQTTRSALLRMGIDLRDVDQPIGTLSGGERQCVAIARAVHFGAKVLVLDEPTAALGVKQSGVVLKYVAAARDAGLGVVLITHNPHHAYLVGDRFVLLKRGAMAGSHTKAACDAGRADAPDGGRQRAGGAQPRARAGPRPRPAGRPPGRGRHLRVTTSAALAQRPTGPVSGSVGFRAAGRSTYGPGPAVAESTPAGTVRRRKHDEPAPQTPQGR